MHLCLSYLLCLPGKSHNASAQIPCIYQNRRIHQILHLPEINLFPRTQCTDVASEYILPGPLPEALVDSAVLMASALAPVTTPRTPHATAETWPSPSMSPSPRVLSWQPTPSPTSSPSTASLMSRSFLLAATIQSPHAMLAAAATHPLVDGPPTKTALASRKVSPLFDGYTAVLVALHAEWSCGLVTLQ